MNKNVIIVAGGSGSRMGSTIPKQFLKLGSKPVLMHSILAFYNYDISINIVLVLPEHQMSYWEKLCVDYSFFIGHKIVVGGKTRFHSVKNGLDHINEGMIAIHDGVRPLVSKETINEAFELASIRGNTIPVVQIEESVRLEEHGSNNIIERDNLKIIQTPQVFENNLIKGAYQQGFEKKFTDDASVLESMGETIYLSPGNKENIKITTSVDLIVAEALLKIFEG